MCEIPFEEYVGTLRWLRVSLVNLASSAEEQIVLLIKDGTYPLVDELALEFGTWDPLVDDLEALNLLAPSPADAIRRIRDMFDAIGGQANAALWTPSALQTASEWSTIRQLARRALENMPSLDTNEVEPQ